MEDMEDLEVFRGQWEAAVYAVYEYTVDPNNRVSEELFLKRVKGYYLTPSLNAMWYGAKIARSLLTAADGSKPAS